MRLKNNVSTAHLEMDGSNRSAHCSLVLIHAGKMLAKFAGLTDDGIWCMRRICSLQSPVVHLHIMHHITRQQHSHASSKWQKEMCFSKSVRIYLPQCLQFPDCVQSNRSLHSFCLRARFCRYRVTNANKTRGQSPRR